MKSSWYILVLLLVLLITALSTAQQENKFRLHSVSLGIGYFDYLRSDLDNVSFIDEPSKKANLNLNGDVAFQLDDYIFSFYFALGLVDPIPYKQSSYSEYNLTIGKVFLNKNWFALEGHLGMGYFEYRERYQPNGPVEPFGGLGFPLRIKANFYLSKHFAIGLNPNANINFDSSILTINLIGQIRF